jgi:hypothetical protein
VLFAEIARILPDLGDKILLGDDLRYGPGRIEIDLDDLGRDLRRRARGLAGDHIAFEREIAVLHCLGDKGRNIDEHVARRLVDAYHALNAREIALQLLETLGRGHVEGGKRTRIDETRNAETIPDLEARESLEKFLVEGRVVFGPPGDVALDDEMSPDGGDLGSSFALPERDLIARHRPAAGRDDLTITLDRLLKRGNGGLAHERHVDAVAGAQAVIEIGPHLLALFPLLGRDRAAVGKAVEGIERVEGARRLGRQREQSGRQRKQRSDTCGKAQIAAARPRFG